MVDFLNTGALTKLTFTPYQDSEFRQEVSDTDPYSVMFNPEELGLTLEIERDESQGTGTTSSQAQFRQIKPQEYKIDFIVDGTGVTTGISEDVPDNVEQFLRVVYNYNSENHRPNYVKITYGAVLLKGVLKSVGIKYNIFSPNGKPLRAKISTTFTSCLDPDLSQMINNPSSPDLTHVRTVKEGQKLAQMAYLIYKNNNYYMDVARVNDLDNFREIKKGDPIIFPPLIKDTKKK